MSATFPTLSPLDVPTLSGSWKPLDWSPLYAVWWGVPLDANLDMLVVPEPLSELLGFMGYIEADTILIRDEYKILYDRATQYLTARPTGIVVSGSPGTGKSIGLIYLLRRRMADRLTTMLTVGILTYIVAPQGAFVQPSTSVIDLDIPRYRPPMWSLVATRKGVREQPHWALVSSRASAIQATSPDMSTYKGWRSNRSAPVWCMAPWSREELYRALPLQFIYPNQPDQQAEIRRRLEDAITTYGPHSARTVFDALLSPGRVSASLEIALGSIHRANLTKILSETKASPDSVFHSLFTVVRVGTHDFDDDTVAVQFSSPYIATRVRETLKMLEFQEARHLIQLYQMSPESGSLGGWVFESYASQIICGRGIVDDILSLTEMDRLNPRNRASFAYTPAVMEDNELVFTSGLDEELEDGTGAGWDDLSLVANEREVCFYNTIKEDVKLDQRYYTPSRSTNPLFDAFSFDIISRGGRRLITINLFQMTTAQSHGGSAKGYDDVASLRSKVERRVAMEEWESCEIRIRYILVVPSTPKRRVVWHLPGGWSNSKVKGPVYVLLIPVRTHEA